MQERERIRLKKEAGVPKPWSDDPIFQTTYFCNVNRENDRVTKFIRGYYSGKVSDPMFEVNIGFSRIINEPDTLGYIGYIEGPESFGEVGQKLLYRQSTGQRTFGDAYIVSTNGRAMPKAQYVAEVLLPALMNGVGPNRFWHWPLGPASLAVAYGLYMRVFGISSFMAGQNLADLKNTPGHPLYAAPDRYTWSCAGPGSLRGLSWIFRGSADQPLLRRYEDEIRQVSYMLEPMLDPKIGLDMQDLQNCLCEFDKYMRISNGTGRSKRRYPGT